MNQPPQQPATPGRSEAFAAWARFVIRHRFAMIAATLGLSLLAGRVAFTSLRADTSDENFLATDDDSTRALQEIRQEFGQDMLFLVLVGGDVFSLPYLERLRKLQAEVERLDIATEYEADTAPAGPSRAPEGAEWGDEDDGWGGETGGHIVDQVVSILNVRQTLPMADGIRVEGLMDDWPDAAKLPALKRRVLSDRTLVGQVIDGTGTHSVLVLRTRALSTEEMQALYEALLELEHKYDTEAFEVSIAGAPAISAAMRGMLIGDTGRSMWLTGLVGLLITFMLFRHPIGVIGPFLVVWQAEIWILGAMAATDTPMTLVTAILPAFIGCVGLGDAMHILTVYRSARARGIDNDQAIVEALATTGVPVLLTTLTTAVGLLSFRLASLEAISQMGTFGALGVVCALLNSIIFLPALLTFNTSSLLGAPRPGQGPGLTDRVLLWFDRLTAPVPGDRPHRRRNIVLGVCTVLAAVAVYGTAQVRVYHDGVDWFPPDHPAARALNLFEDTVGGTSNIALLIDALPGHSLREREALLAIERVETHVLAYDDGSAQRSIRNVTSLLDPVRESWRAMHGDVPDQYGLPPTQRGVSDMLTLFESAGPQQLKQLVTVDMQRTLMTVRVTWQDAMGYAPMVEYMRAVIDEVSDVISIRPTGSVYISATIISRLVSDLARSFGTAAFVIAVLMVFLLRSIKIGLIAMLPNLLPILTVMAFMGFTGIPLDTSTLMVGSVAMGIVVDDTIHFLHQFRVHFGEHSDVDAAIRHALLHSGRAMLATSIILVAGFTGLLSAELLNAKLFGILVSLTVIAALVLDFTFMPALLRLIYARDDSQNGSSGAPQPAVAGGV